eukprot:scaffold65602_cov33-Attheya_sp.AAC.2
MPAITVSWHPSRPHSLPQRCQCLPLKPICRNLVSAQPHFCRSQKNIHFAFFLEYHSNNDCAASIGLICHLIITDSPQIHRKHATALTSLETPPRMLRQMPTSRLPCTKTETEHEKIYIWSFLAYHSNDDCADSIGLIRHPIITASPQIYRGHLTALPSLEKPPRTLQKRPTS